jgi:2'-5' RNA ligase
MELKMGCDPNGMLYQIPAEQRLNVFALVIYIPDPLGRFLDDLRKELVPGCNPHAHVSVLPPRPIAVDWQLASEQVRRCASSRAAFDVTLGCVSIFPVTNVIYIELATGADELFEMHSAMNSDALAFDEPFEYHPHITLAQEISPGSVAEVEGKARRMWDAYSGPRTFRAGRASFVQNTLGNCWIDLSHTELGVLTR